MELLRYWGLPPTRHRISGIPTFQLLAGAARREITPPIGLPMDGYSARAGVASGVHDPLWARALLVEGQDRHLILVSCDLIGISPEVVASVGESLEPSADVTWGLFISATHTHSGPAGIRPPVDETVVARVTNGIVGAVQEARGRLAPARIGAGWGTAPGVGANRRNADSPYDPLLGVLRVDTDEGRPVAILGNFACHPTVLSADNLQYSRDFPGSAVTSLEESIGGGVVALFVNGACGDISTRFTRSAQTFGEADRLGRRLAEAAMDVYRHIRPARIERLATASTVLRLPPKPAPAPATIEAELATARNSLARARASGVTPGQLRIAETAVQGLERQAARVKEPAPQEIPAEVGAFALEGIAGVSWPGEVFNAYAAELRRRAGTQIFAFGYTNGAIGYVPTRQAFAEGGYEAASARVGIDAGEMIVEASLRLLRSVARDA